MKRWRLSTFYNLLVQLYVISRTFGVDIVIVIDVIVVIYVYMRYQ